MVCCLTAPAAAAAGSFVNGYPRVVPGSATASSVDIVVAVHAADPAGVTCAAFYAEGFVPRTPTGRLVRHPVIDTTIRPDLRVNVAAGDIRAAQLQARSAVAHNVTLAPTVLRLTVPLAAQPPPRTLDVYCVGAATRAAIPGNVSDVVPDSVPVGFTRATLLTPDGDASWTFPLPETRGWVPSAIFTAYVEESRTLTLDPSFYVPASFEFPLLLDHPIHTFAVSEYLQVNITFETTALDARFVRHVMGVTDGVTMWGAEVQPTQTRPFQWPWALPFLRQHFEEATGDGELANAPVFFQPDVFSLRMEPTWTVSVCRRG